jgi:hypothetical protein
VGDGLPSGLAVLNGDVEGVGADKLLDCTLYDPRGSPKVAELVVSQLVHHGDSSLGGRAQSAKRVSNPSTIEYSPLESPKHDQAQLAEDLQTLYTKPTQRMLDFRCQTRGSEQV